VEAEGGMRFPIDEIAALLIAFLLGCLAAISLRSRFGLRAVFILMTLVSVVLGVIIIVARSATVTE
jgi:hypothetical protein